MVGKSLGPYRILEQLGKGGMGEVWLAEDTRLGRKVAVKVLPGELAADADRRSRFEQEAKAAAALNHPHIAAVHDVGVETADGEANPMHYMVQEHLQGETLRETIARGTVSFDKALALCIEIGEALKAAHRAGIVHRDLKPDNVFISQDGHAKVLDFGLAKLTEIALPSGISASASPTMTMAGQMLGTAGYMAPEQVRGEDVDERVDLFALGCVLYEAVSGKRAFGGENVHESLSKVLSGEPDPIAGTGNAQLNWILDKLLQKDREQRYQSAGDVVVDLRRLASGNDSFDTTPAPAISEPAAPARRSPVLAVGLAVVALLAGGLGGWLMKRTPPAVSAAHDVRFDVLLPKDQEFNNNYNRVATISPDARAIAYTAGGGAWIRFLDRMRPELVPDSAGARGPAFSADGQRIAFWASGHIKRFTLGESASVIVTPFAERPMGIHWSTDGFIYVGRADQGIWRAPADGGEAEQVLAVEPGEAAHGPEPLPGGEWMLFTLGHGVRAWGDASIVAQNLTTNERRVLIERGREVRATESGHLVYVQDGTLFAAPFDADAVAVTGGSFALGESVHTSAYDETGAAAYDVSDDGVLAFAPPTGYSDRDSRLVWLDTEGVEEPLPFDPRRFAMFNLSPDGRFVAAEVRDIAGTHIWVYRIDRSSGQRLTTTGRNTFPAWSHDGEYVYFASDRDGDIDIWRRRADLSLPAEQMLDAEGPQMPTSVSQDGAWLLYMRMAPSNTDIERLSLTGDSATEVLVASPADELAPSFSSDGRYICYQSDETGRWDIMVREIASGRRWVVSSALAYNPVWSRDGKAIFYKTTGDSVYRVPVRTEPEFSADEGQPAFQNDPSRHSVGYVVTADGSRMLVASSEDESDPLSETRHRVTVVMNWFDELD